MTIRHEIHRLWAGHWPQTWRGWAIFFVIFILCYTAISTFIDIMLDGQPIWTAASSNVATGIVFGGAFCAVQWFRRRRKRPYIDGK